MKPLVVVDTNVVRVANGGTDHADLDCVIACIERLQRVRKGERVAVDWQGEIWQEYQKNWHRSGSPGPGDEFFLWLSNNQSHPEHCVNVMITAHSTRGFEEFPKDASLRAFDRDDRKFVAVAVASGQSPPILNAVDRDWWVHRKALKKHGVGVEFLCPQLMKPDPGSRLGVRQGTG